MPQYYVSHIALSLSYLELCYQYIERLQNE